MTWKWGTNPCTGFSKDAQFFASAFSCYSFPHTMWRRLMTLLLWAPFSTLPHTSLTSLIVHLLHCLQVSLSSWCPSANLLIVDYRATSSNPCLFPALLFWDCFGPSDSFFSFCIFHYIIYRPSIFRLILSFCCFKCFDVFPRDLRSTFNSILVLFQLHKHHHISVDFVLPVLCTFELFLLKLFLLKLLTCNRGAHKIIMTACTVVYS